MLQVIGHRGASSYAPENTFPSFDLALEMGADGLETDIQATQDGVLVLIHDRRVDRTTNGSGAVNESTWADLGALDAGAWFAPRFAGTRIPTLEAFLARYAGRTGLALEIKAPGVEAGVVDALRRYDLGTSLTLTSFNWESVIAVRELAPVLRVSWLTRTFDPEAIERVRAAGMVQICPKATEITPELVDLAHREGLEVRAWGLADEALMVRVVESGADGTSINFPDVLLGYLREHGLR
ncbi:MAG: hypothetical protein GXY76_21150 [Chloroflexi bacterium]|nr:hypothetical protein [Chloroflexota bacterium]